MRRCRVFLVGVLVPVGMLSAQGSLAGFDAGGVRLATTAGALGAAGAACIIFAFRTGGLPVYVMPLVFGGAPIVNVLYTIIASSAEDGAESDALCRVSARGSWGGDGAVFQADCVKHTWGLTPRLLFS